MEIQAKDNQLMTDSCISVSKIHLGYMEQLSLCS